MRALGQLRWSDEHGRLWTQDGLTLLQVDHCRLGTVTPFVISNGREGGRRHLSRGTSLTLATEGMLGPSNRTAELRNGEFAKQKRASNVQTSLSGPLSPNLVRLSCGFTARRRKFSTQAVCLSFTVSVASLKGLPERRAKELDFSSEQSVHVDVIGGLKGMLPIAKSASPQWRGFGWWEHCA